ncbi:unnamed protein product [Prunus armeniaca]
MQQLLHVAIRSVLEKPARIVLVPKVALRYIAEEAIEFCTEHLSDVSTVGVPSSQKMGVSKPLSGCTVSIVDRDLLNQAHLYVLENTEEVLPYIEQHMIHIKTAYPKFRKRTKWLQDKHNNTFIQWLRFKVQSELNEEDNHGVSENLRWLAAGLNMAVPSYRSYLIKGIKFNIKAQDDVQSELNEEDNHGVSENLRWLAAGLNMAVPSYRSYLIKGDVRIECELFTRGMANVDTFDELCGDLSSFNFSPLQRLTTLDLGNNYFTGEFPKSLYSCKSLTAIRLTENQLTGQISPEIVALESLAFLSISTNNMTNATGALRILKGCKNLTSLILSNNFPFEPVPDDKSLGDLDGFQSLRVFSLGGCQFTGQVPTWLAKLKNLQVLDLSFNLITGSVPGWLASLPNLFYIDLSNNLLQGGFPNDLCGMPVLTSKEASDNVDRSYLELPVFVKPNNATDQQYNQLSNLPPAIYLSNNSLNGSIPIEIGRLKFIHVLDLSHNKFSGSIPDQISNLTNLEKLDLSYNNLSGEIPVSLKGLHFLSSFSVAYNDLQGLVPSGGQFDTFTISSFEGNPGLCGPLTPKRSCHQSPQSPPQVLEVTRRSKTQTILIALVFGIFFGIGFGIGFSMDDKKIPIIGWRRK